MKIQNTAVLSESPIEKPNELSTDLQHLKAISEYYEQAGPDYEAWSGRYNMHFGYYRAGINPFNREAMLEEMNQQIGKRLQLDKNSPYEIADLGCGLGATARSMALQFPQSQLYGISICPWQVQQARKLNVAAQLQDRVQMMVGDYTIMPFADGSLDGCYAIESACYAPGNDKAPLLQEAARVIKPGGKLVIADGFFKHDRPQGKLMQRLYRRLSECWVIREFALLPSFKHALVKAGFTNVKVEEIGFRVAPSVTHIPITVMRFLGKELWRTGSLKLNRNRTNNFIGPLLGMLAGLNRSRFGYYIITATKAGEPKFIM
ncbi:hypothetical protein BH09BAC1_BH09BAC1_01890 [soil metagenome]